MPHFRTGASVWCVQHQPGEISPKHVSNTTGGNSGFSGRADLYYDYGNPTFEAQQYNMMPERRLSGWDRVLGIEPKTATFRVDVGPVSWRDPQFGEFAEVPAGTAFQQILTETLTLADDLTRSSVKALAESIALSDVRTASLTRDIVDALALADATGKVTTRPLVEQVALADTIVATKIVIKELVEQLLAVDTLSKTATHVLNETVTLVDGRTVTLQRVLAEAIALGDTRTATFTKTLLEVVAASDSILALKIFLKILTETITLADPTLGRQIVKQLTETIALIETRSAALTRVLAETLTLVANATKMVTKAPLVETVALVDAVTKAATKALSEAVSLVDGFSRVITAVRVLVDGLTLSDEVRKTIERVLVEAMVLADVVAGGAAYSPVSEPGQFFRHVLVESLTLTSLVYSLTRTEIVSSETDS